jgi:hypothetical protein
METVLDHTYLRPSRATVIARTALAVGAGIFLAAWGLPSLWHPYQDRLEALDRKVAANFEVLNAKIDDRVDTLNMKIETLSQNVSRLEPRVVSVEPKSSQTQRPSGISPDTVIKKEVTVFRTVDHENGTVVTGWKYPDGASENQSPTYQYCYWKSGLLGDTTAEAVIHIATNGERLPNIASTMPDLERAIQKCIWWNDGSGQ